MLFNALTWIFLVLLNPHDYHVGIFDIEIKDHRVQISQKLFSDDVQKALMLSGLTVRFGDNINEEELSKSLQQYIKKHFAVTINDEKAELTYIGSEWDDDFHTFFMFWQVDLHSDEVKTIDIFNDILLEVTSDQQNMHRVKSNEKEFSLLLDKSRTKGQIQF